MKFIAIDFETANNSRTSACSLGITFVENKKIIKTKHFFIKPTPNYYNFINVGIHDITKEDTEDKGDFKELWEEIKPYFENNKVIAHNASFDLSVLRASLEHYQIEFPKLEYYCTMLLSKSILKGLLNYQLPTVSEYFNINLSHHNAESDAKACAEILIRLLENENIDSFEKLCSKYNFSKGELLDNFQYNPFKVKSSQYNFKRIDLDSILCNNENIDEEHLFYQKRVIFTGELETMTRPDALQRVANVGGIIKPQSFSSKINFLVVGNQDYAKFGEGHKSTKMLNAEKFIEKGYDIEIINESQFITLVQNENSNFEITIDLINKNSKELLERKVIYEFSKKDVYFSDNFEIQINQAFQLIGNLSGYGHNYDFTTETNYFIISNKEIKDLENNIKSAKINEVEQYMYLRVNAKDSDKNNSNLIVISEQCLYDYYDLTNRER
ncbi:3'-5' exoribonuclease [Flavobacterium psychrophilum]|uniref:exonuclease domain-containing protein n=1 Tax=Flavobacterium psychrophilum TaxID=96345 RepID=UPI000B7C3C9D|nr:exonuclease domain-containing protein [Flavobacterium psychrophilum]EKT4497685.1 3'-5' exoribonuclease [Flavobacterium psychrophilum]SNB04835.1 hypothetical protein of prophage 6H. Putative DNA polymerase / exonuclease [Flavobacterium psychrophilum]